MTNKIKELLLQLNLSDDDSIHLFHEKVRDRNDISVLKCDRSGVLFLSRDDHMDMSHYNEKDDFSYWGVKDRKESVLKVREDTNRRFEDFSNLVTNKKWLEVGAGSGAMLDKFNLITSCAHAAEPQNHVRSQLINEGYIVYEAIQNIPNDQLYDVITLFHVFEHMTDPIESLIHLRNKLEKGGKIVIEVPHANDFLISFYNLKAFKDFTFWSEHLILHTRTSLQSFLSAAGFREISIVGCQRYPLANHLYWLHEQKPGGHMKWDHIRNEQLDSAYEDLLSRLDCTDTLVAVASV